MSIYTKYIDEGYEAGLSGAECWENPYVQGSDEPTMTQAWHAGWCRGRQERNRRWLDGLNKICVIDEPLDKS